MLPPPSVGVAVLVVAPRPPKLGVAAVPPVVAPKLKVGVAAAVVVAAGAPPPNENPEEAGVAGLGAVDPPPKEKLRPVLAEEAAKLRNKIITKRS